MHPFEIAADEERSVLRMHFRGVVTAEVLQTLAEHSAAVVGRMRSGFTVVADLTQLERMDLDCVPHITRLMDLFRAAGVARVLRVIPDPDKDIGFTLLSHTHYRGKVPFQTLTSLAEAESALATALDG